MAKHILGLDLGTNSIGWALVATNEEGKPYKIEGMGSRIIPMTQDVLDTFSGGKPLETQTSARTGYRGTRRLREKHLLRRERLHRVLNVLGFLPEQYEKYIDFDKRLGQFLTDTEPKLTWKMGENGNQEFIFLKSFNEMLSDFETAQPHLFYIKPNGKETKIPYDWTIYYLRKKALTEKITKEELAWIILNFNQKRGYYQLRGEEEEGSSKAKTTRKYFDKKKIINITDTNEVYKGLKVLLVELDGGNKGKIFKKEIPEWIGLEKNIIATVDIDKDGNDRFEDNGLLRQRFSIPTDAEWDTEWKLIKLKTENDLRDSDKTVGEYIYDNLLQNPNVKVKGKLVRTIERGFYRDELKAILKKQIELQPELFSDDLYSNCIRELYRNNEAHQLTLSKRDFVHLFVEDIIFYQRPLRSQKSSIGNCSLEYRIYKDKEGNKVKEYLKAIPKSHPLYQEFRVWQWLSNLKLYRKIDDVVVTNEFLNDENEMVGLFDFLMTQKEVNHKDVLKHLITPILNEKYPHAKPKAFNSELDKEIAKYRWNYVFDDSKEKEDDKSKKYPCNTTGYEIRRRFEKVENIADNFLSPEIEQHLWHIIYSVTDKNEYESALKKFAIKYNLDEISFVDNFKKFPPFKSEYGSFSEKAIKKLLPLMRLGKYWNEDEITIEEKQRAQSINERLDAIAFDEKEIEKISDDDIQKPILKSFAKRKGLSFTKGLQMYQASYFVYGVSNDADKWNSIGDLEKYLEKFKQHSLRNPIVEQIVTETLRVVRDIWKYYGNGDANFFDEIHVELGRDMKNTADERKYMTQQISNNEVTNLRIKALLAELQSDISVQNVRPNSPMQQDALKIYEEYALQNEERYVRTDEDGVDIFVNDPIGEDILKISKMAQPSKSELQRYKLWLEQRYRSPYTGQMIPLGRLFTEDYQIEHVIPKSRYFDDSFNNKVICESAVNQYKDKQLGLEFIQSHYGEIVDLGLGKTARILTEEQYRTFVDEHYQKSGAKRRILLLDEIPEKMIARQMNDTRYISKFVCNLLSNIVRADKGDDGINSKNLIPGNGKITTRLKKDWGLNDVWNDLMLPRFERMNQITNTNAFTYWNEQYQKNLPIDYSPIDSKRIEKKRIDHRHHAMDALVIACMTRDHVNLLNNQSAKSEKSRYDLQYKLRITEKQTYVEGKTKQQVEKDVFKEFKKPWGSFTVDAKTELENIIVSFKQNLRVINKATNHYEKYVDGKKTKIAQEGVNWAIRKPMHKETVSGKVDLPWTKVSKGKILTATRKNVDISFNLKTIESITDTGIQKILKNYLASKGGDSEIAFSPEGLEDLNKNITLYNDGKSHQPIYKVRIFEQGSKFPLGETGNKNNKYVESAKGTNLFFAVYQDKDGKRSYESIPLNVVIERQKQGLNTVELKGENDFYLSPNDLVYITSEDERESNNVLDFKLLNAEQIKRIYKVVSFSGNQCFFVQSSVASSVVNKLEFSSLNKMERSVEGVMIKEVCIKIDVNRLGK